jgi:hypothetical protein
LGFGVIDQILFALQKHIKAFRLFLSPRVIHKSWIMETGLPNCFIYGWGEGSPERSDFSKALKDVGAELGQANCSFS